MSAKITEHSFYQYLKCPSWVAQDAKAGQKEDSLRRRLQEDGLLPEVERKILASRKVVEILAEDLDEAALETISEMKKGTQTIYRGVLMVDRFVARPDILERVEGKSALGGYYYVACDIKRSKHLKEEYKLQGCFYAEVLNLIQGAKPVQGYIMQTTGQVESYLLEDFATRYQLTLDAIERILDGQEEPHFLTSDCKQSPWFHVCKDQTVSCDDLSRLNRIWRSEAKELALAGFTTLTSFASLHPDLVAAKVKGIPRERLDFLHLQAVTLISGKPHVLRRVDLPPSEVALVVDVESDPLRDADYLFGVLVVDGEEKTYHSFLAKDPKDEQRAWEDFVNFVKDYVGVPLYHYGWSEIDVFRSLAKKYNTPPDVLANIEEQSIDLLGRLRESVIFPLSFYSLKDIAQFLGFHWRHQDASGLNSVLWYEEWLKSGNQDALKDVIEYNEDDVLATWHLQQWALKNT